MDDDKKYTAADEFEDDFEKVTADETISKNETKTSQDEFDEFNFTDDFPDEFSEEFMKTPNDALETKEEEPFNPDLDFDDDFLSKDLFKEEDTDFNKEIDTNIDHDLDMDADIQGAIPPVDPTQRQGNFFKRHPWISLFMLLTLLFGGYKLLQSTGSQEITPVPTAKITSAKPSQTTNGGVEIRQIDDRLDTIEQGMNVLNDQLTQLQGAHVRIEQMEQMVTKIAEEEGGLQDVLTRLEALNNQVTALNSLNQRLGALEAQVGVIANEVDLHVTVAEQTQRAANLSRQAMQAKSMIPVPMVVQAVIPGRAWLMSQTGELITVARGDDVPGYGRVMNIDPVAGTVTMSSETVFREEE